MQPQVQTAGLCETAAGSTELLRGVNHSMEVARQIRCPDCHKRLFDLEPKDGMIFSLVIACRCDFEARFTGHEKSRPLG